MTLGNSNNVAATALLRSCLAEHVGSVLTDTDDQSWLEIIKQFPLYHRSSDCLMNLVVAEIHTLWLRHACVLLALITFYWLDILLRGDQSQLWLCAPMRTACLRCQ
jgi:hypothetical protein